MEKGFPTRVLLVASALAALLVWPIRADAGPVPVADLTLAPSSGAPGDVIALSGTCGEPGWDAVIVIDGGEPNASTFVTLPTNPDGSFAGQFVVPQHFAAGDYEANLSCTRLDVVGAFAGPVPFTVTSGPAGSFDYTLAPSAGLAGSVIEVTGQCPFLSTEDQARVELFGPPAGLQLVPAVVASTPTAADGSFATSVVVPETFAVGSYFVYVICALGDQEVLDSTTFEVTGPAPTTTSLPATTTTTSPPVTATPTFTG